MKGDVPLLKRLGPIPFWRGESKCLDELERIYHRAMEDAKKQIEGRRLKVEGKGVLGC